MFDQISKSIIEHWPTFEERRHFISIGNFLHEPNWDSVLYLKNKIWTEIKKQIPDAELHIYGAYTSQKVEQLHNQKEGFVIKGRCENLIEYMQSARVCLSPLRFGAGIKGKLADAMLNGTPSITTSIGAESMNGNSEWSGFISDDAEEIIQKAVLLYTKEYVWKQKQINGIEIINQHFSKEIPSKLLVKKITNVQNNLNSHRENNFIGSILNLQNVSATKYMSLWIEEKNKPKQL
jgi:glycosyltransferase involved in cell wall biosynthesis